MNAELFFSFLMFFQVQMDSIRNSGFYQVLDEKFPQITQGLNELESEDEIQKLMNLTGAEFNDLKSFNLTIEGLDGMTKLKGRSPKFGSDIDLLASSKFEGQLKADELIDYMLDQLEQEMGEEERKQVEKTKKVEGNVTFMTVPVEVMGDESSASDLLMALKSGKKISEIIVGIPEKVKDVVKKGVSEPNLACLEAMSKTRQVSLAVKIDPAIWERPEFSANQQNPLFAGLANSVKGIREFGFSLSFLDDSMGVELCVHCVDTQSALGLWTVAQGGLGMAQLAMSQEGSRAPSILGRIKTQAVEKNVFVRVEVLPKDLDELESQFMPNSGNSRGRKTESLKKETDPLIGQKAPDAQSVFLNGGEFRLSDQKGKVVVLDFWATWCGPCVRALPELVKATSTFDKEKVSFIAVNQGEGKKIISKFLKSKKFNSLKVVLDRNQKIGGDYGVEGIPRTVVIDQHVIIRYVHVGFSPGIAERLQGEISKILAE
ncbi:MAG: TlpA family protein disulfide reductase [Opitutae bacterium]|nr:TlpA family protein disulfide reductase [Opitutae bacterium]